MLSVIAICCLISILCRVFYKEKAEGNSDAGALFSLGRRIFSIRYLFFSQIDEDLTPIQKAYVRRSNFFLKVFYVFFCAMVLAVFISVAIMG